MTFATTTLVALVVAFAVPVSQLRTVLVTHECCCPDPEDCHCPKEKPDAPAQPTMKACHSTTQVVVSPEAPSIETPEVVVPAPAVIATTTSFSLPAPHESPAPARPAAPS